MVKSVPLTPVEHPWATILTLLAAAFVFGAIPLSLAWLWARVFSPAKPGVQKNADGSVEIFFGATPPSGKETNWVPTDPNGKFELMFRLYGPEKPLFDKSWRLPDVEKVT